MHIPGFSKLNSYLKGTQVLIQCTSNLLLFLSTYTIVNPEVNILSDQNHMVCGSSCNNTNMAINNVIDYKYINY